MKKFCFKCNRVFEDKGQQCCSACGAELGRLVQGNESSSEADFTLKKLPFVKPTDRTAFLGNKYRVPEIAISNFEIDADVLALISKEMAERLRAIPVNRAGTSLVIAMEDPGNVDAIAEICAHTGLNVDTVLTSEHEIDLALATLYK